VDTDVPPPGRNVGYYMGRGGTIGYLIDKARSSSSTASSPIHQAVP
jgi:hypothetical protein